MKTMIRSVRHTCRHASPPTPACGRYDNTMTLSASPDPLRLDLCPACGYALEGLPDAGRCPECGVEYRPGLIVLHGFGTGISTARAKTAWTTAAINLLVAFYFVTKWYRLRSFDSFDVLYPTYLLLWTGWALWKRWASDMPGLVQIWLGPDGARQVNHPTAGIVKPGPVTPWREIGEVGIKTVNEQTVRVRLVGPTTFLRGKHVMYAEVNCGAERAAMLRKQIAAWRAANAVGKMARAP